MHMIRKTIFIALGVSVLLAGCAPAQQASQSPEQIQAQIETSVAATVDFQNQMGTSVAMTVQAMVPAATETSTPTTIPLDIPTLTPIFTATPFVVVPPSGGGGGGGSTTPKYACDPDTGKKPRDNTVFHPGDPFDIKWTIINTGTVTWPAGKDFDYFSGPHMSPNNSAGQLPEVKPGKSVSYVFSGTAPMEKGFHVMTWKVEGGFCFPYIAIDVEDHRAP
jgi:hypothetical protein